METISTCGCGAGNGAGDRVIASVSLGAERPFRLKGKDGIAFAEQSQHGSLFITAGKTQKNLKHEVPKAPDIALRGLTD